MSSPSIKKSSFGNPLRWLSHKLTGLNKTGQLGSIKMESVVPRSTKKPNGKSSAILPPSTNIEHNITSCRKDDPQALIISQENLKKELEAAVTRLEENKEFYVNYTEQYRGDDVSRNSEEAKKFLSKAITNRALARSNYKQAAEHLTKNDLVKAQACYQDGIKCEQEAFTALQEWAQTFVAGYNQEEEAALSLLVECNRAIETVYQRRLLFFEPTSLNKKVEIFQKAVEQVESAIISFSHASKAKASRNEEAVQAYELKAHCHLRRARAYELGETTNTNNLWMIADAYSKAAVNFQEAARAKTQEQAHALKLSAHYYLQSAQAYELRETIKAKDLGIAGWQASFAPELLEKAAQAKAEGKEEESQDQQEEAEYSLAKAEVYAERGEDFGHSFTKEKYREEQRLMAEDNELWKDVESVKGKDNVQIKN